MGPGVRQLADAFVHRKLAHAGSFFPRHVLRDPEFSRFEAGAQGELVDKKLKIHGIHQRPEAQTKGLNTDKA